jgi:pimeloyl-ACP methyl ester carboxylesterase
VTHLRDQLELFAFGDFLARLAKRYTVIRYDKPGCGLSDRTGVALPFDAQVATAVAVVDALGVDRFRLFGASQGGQLAAALAARHPERVESLVLYGTCADGAELAPRAVRASIVALVRAHWGIGSKLMTGIFVADPSPAEVDVFTRMQRSGATAAVAADLLDVYYRTDIRDLLPAVHARTAVLHREQDTAARFAMGREVASLVPGAVLVPLPGRGHLHYHGEWQAVLDATLDFLDDVVASEPLTGREMEVARLVAAGLTNRAIASRLAIAPRTAEAHVEHIRRKLDVRSRAQIAAWAAVR